MRVSVAVAPTGAVVTWARGGDGGSVSPVATADEIERAAGLLAGAARAPAKVILFGSHARGEAGPRSDLDFLVIQREVASRRKERVRLRGVLRGLGVPVDLVVVSERQVDEWGGVRGTLLSSALEAGRVVAET